jgi:hypothetical protein
MNVARFERFFRVAGGLDVNKTELTDAETNIRQALRALPDDDGDA